MPGHLNDLEARVFMLEQQMAIVSSEGERTRAIVRCVDRDVSELALKLDAHTRVLNALRETQLEHSQRLDGLEREMRNGFSTVNVGMAQITALLTGIAGSDRE